MKRTLSLILALCMALGLAACGQQPSTATPTETVAPAVTATPAQTETPAATPEPAEEPEPEDDADPQLEEAVALGIIDYETALRAEEPALETEIPAMIQAVHVHGYGHESPYLTQMADYALPGRTASRYWFAMGVFYPYCEEYFGKKSTDARLFMDEIAQMQLTPNDIDFRIDGCNFGEVYLSETFPMDVERAGMIGGGTVWLLCRDFESLWLGDSGTMEYWHDYGDILVPQSVFYRFDYFTGEKVMDMDENQMWRPAEKMTIGDAAKTALRYWHSFEEPASLLNYADVGAYDKSIITDELLNRETTLPYNDCANLPAEWHGMLFDKMIWGMTGYTGMYPDRIIRAEDVQIVKDAGLNYIKMNVSFSYLQGPHVESGLLNETRLKLLDKILAMCMENDIHLCITCSQAQDCSEDTSFEEVFYSPLRGTETDAQIADFAAIWGALARRYADIPNEYISFNLFNEAVPSSEAEYERQFGPAVDAIRAESPNRTVIADVYAPNVTGEIMAKRGVALAYHLYVPTDFVYINNLGDLQNDPDYMHSVTWPFVSKQYGGTVFDSAKVMEYATLDGKTSLNDMLATAEQYGVGAIVNEFGMFGQFHYGYARYRYTDETFYGYFTDMITAFEEKGIPWVCGEFNGVWGPVQVYPALYGVEYEKVGYYYVDTKMQEFFRSWAK